MNPCTGFDVVEVVQQIEGTDRRCKLFLEGCVNHGDCLVLDVSNLALEIPEAGGPLRLILFSENVVLDLLNFVNIVLDTVGKFVDLVAAARDGLEIFVENGLEVLDCLTYLPDVLTDLLDVLRLLENFLGLGELPAQDCGFAFDVQTHCVKRRDPVLQHADGLVDFSDRLLNAVFGLEDGPDVDFVANFLADFVADGLNDVLEVLVLIWVADVSADGPDQLESVQQRLQSVLDLLKLAFVDVLELALKREQELDEVLGDGVLLLEVLFLLPECLHVVFILILGLFVGQFIQDGCHLLDLWHVELLVQRVVLRRSLRPEFSLTGSGVMVF